jgi:hypothetical protein
VDRANAVRAAVGLLECDLELLGLTGVEDKLQDDVKITLELLRNAGLVCYVALFFVFASMMLKGFYFVIENLDVDRRQN